MRILVCLAVLSACHGDPAAPAGDDDQPPAPDVPVDSPATADMPALQLCTVVDPTNLASAFVATPNGDGITYTCVQSCSDWTTCSIGVTNAQGQPIRSVRGNLQIQALAFVVDGMAGHFAFTPDGDDVVITHAGAGGTSTVNTFDRGIQSQSTIKTVSLGWEPGTTAVGGSFSTGGAGWFTRKDRAATNVRALVGRAAAAIQWVKDNFAQGNKLGTVGSSMGTIATFGAKVWYGLEPIIDYQMLIGGPGFWDVNAGCGRVHASAGHCDVDVAACTGNPMSSYGNDDPSCGSSTTNSCRVPTVMAPLADGSSAYNNIINYVGATTACAPSAVDARDASLDISSLASTVTSWTFHGPVDFVTNEGGTQPPDADQGMGEGHMMMMYAAIQSKKSWTDNEGYHHGDAWDAVPALIQAAGAIVVAGMGH